MSQKIFNGIFKGKTVTKDDEDGSKHIPRMNNYALNGDDFERKMQGNDDDY